MAVAAGLAFYIDAATLLSVAIALPIWRDHFGLGIWQVGLLTGGLAFAVAIGALIGGWLGDRYGRGLVFTYDLVVFVLGTLVIITAPNGIVLTVGVIIVGLAAGADVPTALAVIADHAPDHARGRLTAVTQVLWIGAVLTTYAVGFAVSTLGLLGTRILIGHVVLLAAVTLGLRLALTIPDRRGLEPSTHHPKSKTPARALLAAGTALPLLLTGVFFLFWNIASSTLGNYGPYILRTATGLSQTQATGLALVAFPPALVISVIFVRLADTGWRDRLFPVAMVIQIAAFVVGTITGGTVLLGMVALVFLYSLSNVFAGEAIYKVWSQLLLPAQVRATGIGLTYAVARAAAAAFMLVVPAIVAASPTLLLGLLGGCVLVSGLTGLIIIRHRPFAELLHPTKVTARI